MQTDETRDSAPLPCTAQSGGAGPPCARTIIVQTIAHERQRYPTTGDWIYNREGESLFVYVSEMGDWRYNMLVAIHEAVEALLCIYDQVPQTMVDSFDILFEKMRDGEKPIVPRHMLPTRSAIEASLANDDGAEPGDCIAAPYYKQHQIATGVERILATLLGVSWEAYEARMDALYVQSKPG